MLDTQDKLGEGCFWDAATQCLWWLDLIVPSAIHRLHVASGAYRKWQFNEHVTAMAKRRDGTILVGSHQGPQHSSIPRRARFRLARHRPGNARQPRQ